MADPDPTQTSVTDTDQGSGIGFSESRIPNPYYRELNNFLGKKYYNSL
jgi:hypothetical protein